MNNRPHYYDASMAIVATRDFCGNEAQALEQYATDHRVNFSDADKTVIFTMVANYWKRCAAAARWREAVTADRA